MRAILAVGVCAAATGRAAPGALDPTFGRGGVVTTNFGWGNYWTAGQSALLQADGKLVVGGLGRKGGSAFALVRFDADGSPDVSFGDDGRALTVFSFVIDEPWNGVYGVVQQADGKLLALGRSDFTEMTLLRYEVDGSLDETFGTAGRIVVPVDIYDGTPALAQQADGKLVVAGAVSTDDGVDLALVRLNADGSLDGGFGDAGRATLDAGAEEWANALTIQDDGKIVIAGAVYLPNEVRILTTRLLPDGTPDASFGTGGAVITNPTAAWDEALGVVQQADGRLVVVGYVSPATDPTSLVVLRHLSNGTLDPTFGTGGIWTGAMAGNETSAAVVQQPDGRLVVTTSAADASGADFVTLRFLSNGTLDPTFGSGGIVRTDIGGSDVPGAVIRQPDGMLVVAGTGSTNEGGAKMAVIRYDATGVLDPTFGTGGIALASADSTWDVPRALVVQDDGKIVAAGEADGALALARYDLDGRLDAAFGVAGKLRTTLGGLSARASGIVRQGDGKLVAGGDLRTGTSSDFAVARFTADGSVDASFGVGGKRVTNLGGNDEAYTFFQQSDGKLVLGGHASASAALVRYQADGSLDASFGTGGVVLSNALHGVWSLAQQSDGRLVAGGGTGGIGGVPSSFAVARFNTNGTLDSTFGTGGTVVLSFPQSGYWIFYDMLVHPDDKLVAAGGTVLARFNPSGDLDPSFAGGVVFGPVDLFGLGRQPDGKIVGAGADVSGPGALLALGRYASTGSLDLSFGDAGVASALSGAFESVALDVTVLPDGRLVAAAFSDTDFAIARFLGDGPATTTSTSTSTFTTATSSTSTTTTSSTSSSVSTTVTTSSTSSTLGCSDADGDGLCDSGDPCINVAGIRNAGRGRLTARRLLPPAGDDVLLIAGILTLAQPIDPMRDGLRVLYRDGQGVIFDRIVPAGAYDPLTRAGWTAQGTGHRYVNKNGSSEITKVVLGGSASVPGQYKVRIKGRDGGFAGDPDALPVSAVVTFAPPFAGSDGCGEWRFSTVPPACLLSGGGATLKCR